MDGRAESITPDGCQDVQLRTGESVVASVNGAAFELGVVSVSLLWYQTTVGGKV